MSFSIENAKALLDARKIMIPPPIRKRKRSPRHRSISTISHPTATSPNTSSVAFSTVTTEDDEYIAQTLIFLSQDPNSPARKVEKSPEKFTRRRVNEVKEGLFVYECKTCNKTFSSFQALGGHRASHKKPKLALEIKKAPQEIASTSGVVKSEDENNKSEIQGDELALKEEPVIPSNGNGCNNKSRIHKCSICGAEFNSGQALGGHMRRHRPLNANVVIESSEANKDREVTAFDFDLNVPFETDEETLEARGLFCQSNL